jgi:hypothetical protein
MCQPYFPQSSKLKGYSSHETGADVSSTNQKGFEDKNKKITEYSQKSYKKWAVVMIRKLCTAVR